MDGYIGDNSTCARARPLALSGGIVMVSGDTSTGANEYGSAINCGSSSTIMRGPQQYFKLALLQGQTYRFKVETSFYYGRFYIFTQCSAAAINTDCGSKGGTGAVSSSIIRNSSRTIFFTAPRSGNFYVAVDSTSTSSTGKGAFTLFIDTYAVPTNFTCTKAERLTLNKGKVSVSGTTLGLSNEFGTGINCGSSYTTYAGPQAYYKVALKAGQAYKVSLNPSYSGGRFYIFGNTCDVNAINADCGSHGKTGAVTGYVQSGGTGVYIFSPAASGTYTIAVDSTSGSYAGDFTLSVEETTKPDHGSCAKATTVQLVAGKATLSGSTTGTVNEFGFQITCTSTTAADGPQTYYKVTLPATKTYKFDLKPSFSARLYVFGSSCDPAKIETDCSSRGLTGDHKYFYSSGTYTTPLYYRSKGGLHHVAVDSSSPTYHGSYTLDIEEFTPAANGTCAKAKSLPLSSAGTATVTGDTTGVPNEFGTAIHCGNYSAIPYGSQLYYKVQLAAAKTYTFTLSPSYNMARFYVFRNVCTITNINADCASNGQYGHVSGYISKGSSGSIQVTPKAAGAYVIAVDATSTTYSGAFTLSIK